MGNRQLVTKDIIHTTNPIDQKFIFSEKKTNLQLAYDPASYSGLDFSIPTFDLHGAGKVLQMADKIELSQNNTLLFTIRSKISSLRTVYRINPPELSENSHRKDNVATIIGDFINAPFLRYKVYRKDQLVYKVKVGLPVCNITIKDLEERNVAVAYCDASRNTFAMSFAQGADVLLCMITFIVVTNQIRKSFRRAERLRHFT